MVGVDELCPATDRCVLVVVHWPVPCWVHQALPIHGEKDFVWLMEDETLEKETRLTGVIIAFIKNEPQPVTGGAPGCYANCRNWVFLVVMNLGVVSQSLAQQFHDPVVGSISQNPGA